MDGEQPIFINVGSWLTLNWIISSHTVIIWHSFEKLYSLHSNFVAFYIVTFAGVCGRGWCACDGVRPQLVHQHGQGGPAVGRVPYLPHCTTRYNIIAVQVFFKPVPKNLDLRCVVFTQHRHDGAGGKHVSNLVSSGKGLTMMDCCLLRPRTTPFPEENYKLGVIYGVLLWADMNAAAPLDCFRYFTNGTRKQDIALTTFHTWWTVLGTLRMGRASKISGG